MSDTKQFLVEKFQQVYGRQPEAVFFAPGRVNLIGDHTDYNGGMVLPAALTMGTYLAIAKNRIGHWNIASLNKDNIWTMCSVERPLRHYCWVDYPLGICQEFTARGIKLEGYNLLYFGDLPIGASLSSSASIELATAIAFNAISGNPFSQLELVKISQHAENHFVEMNCGIMDQFASGFGKEGRAIALDCNTLDYELVPLEMQGLSFVISNTNKPRELVNSAYNQRRNDCQTALELLQQHCEIESLCQLSVAEFDKLQPGLLSGEVLRRARHAISEHQRVKEAVHALKAHDISRFGQLMNESHDSLRDDYEVSCPELDFLVTESRKSDGVLGSRMTGAGFGGCTITLLNNDKTADFIHQIGTKYQEKFNISADFYTVEIGDGARSLSLD